MDLRRNLVPYPQEVELSPVPTPLPSYRKQAPLWERNLIPRRRKRGKGKLSGRKRRKCERSGKRSGEPTGMPVTTSQRTDTKTAIVPAHLAETTMADTGVVVLADGRDRHPRGTPSLIRATTTTLWSGNGSGKRLGDVGMTTADASSLEARVGPGTVECLRVHGGCQGFRRLAFGTTVYDLLLIIYSALLTTHLKFGYLTYEQKRCLPPPFPCHSQRESLSRF